MDKGAIKTFAIEARKILMKSAATQAGFYGVTKEGCADPIQKGAGFEVYRTIAGTENRIYGNDINRRRKLKEAVESQGFDQVIEETAYTWFNRLIAIRFMEVNGYLPTRTRVLSSETGSNTPDLVAQYMDVDLGMSDEEIEKVADSIKDNRYDDAFALLFIKQCNALNDLLPKLFEKTDDYMELLLKLSYTSDGVVRMLVDTIPESNFNVEEEGQVEIIGWLYQYYNTELKDETFSMLKRNGKVTKERIPSITQLFTPDWIVRYMLENSLGRVCKESSGETEDCFEWDYYLNEVPNTGKYEDLKTVENIKVIDPCMGSGHILVYAFDLLVKAYETQGFSLRDIPELILRNNIYGLDIDKRASQLAYFAVMMKARQYDRRVLNKKITPRIINISESNSINTGHLDYFGRSMETSRREKAVKQIRNLITLFKDAKNYGSMLKVKGFDSDLLLEFVGDVNFDGQMTLDTIGYEDTRDKLIELIEVADILQQKYDVVCTNPPYMGNSNMSEKISSFVKENYPLSKSDLFAVFMEVAFNLCKPNGFVAMITMQSWMFLGSYETLRERIVNEKSIQSLLHLGIKAFEEIGNDVVQTVAFVMGNRKIESFEGIYFRLLTHDREKKVSDFISRNNVFFINQNKFKNIPGMPIAYWVGEATFEAFTTMKRLGDVSEPKQGIATADNNRFLRLWHEVDMQKIGFGIGTGEEAIQSKKKWFPYQKGGDYRKWYGNNSYVVLWENNGQVIKNYKAAVVRNSEYHLREGLSWTWITTGYFGARFSPVGSVFDVAGSTLFANDHLMEILGYLCSCVADYLVKILNPTINFSNGVISKLPVSLDISKDAVDMIRENVEISKNDWDSVETSWDFKRNPLLGRTGLISDRYNEWERECQERFAKIHHNEEAINRTYINLFGLQNEVSEIVQTKDVTVSLADRRRDIKRLISYAVGCMFGRYSLDEDGVVYAGGNWDPKRYRQYIPDEDNCIPITDEAYFSDDIVGRFVEFIKGAFGEADLERNLDYIAESLGNKGKSSLDVIRSYFLSDFYKDHCVMYSVTGSGKRPIYWLFDSGKQNGFKCLVYLHRYDRDTVGRVRSDYLRKAQDAIENALKNADYTIANSVSAVDKATATKKREKYIKQLNETRTYFQALSHVALQRIEIDLDDGVKTNYAKFQGIEIVDENGKKQKIDLLAKI